VYDIATSAWQLRTGAKLDGDAGNNTITGGVSRDYLSGGDGNDTLYGLAGADMLDGGDGNDTLYGGDGNDLLIGGAGTNTLVGGKGDDFYRLSSITDTITEVAGEGYDTVQLDTAFIAGHTAANGGIPYVLGTNLENLTAYGDGAINLTGNTAANRIEGNKSDNVIIGGTGNDYIAGGGGSDTLTGDTVGSNGKAGSDVFAWHLGDGGSVGAPAADKITDFNYGSGYSNVGTTSPAGGGDVLDLRDMLVGEHTSVGDTSTNAGMATIGNLLSYIRVEVKGSDTLMHISTTGGLASTGTDFSKQDQTITLQNVNLYTDTGVTSGNESVLLQTLLKRGSLIVD
jgi:Ca2+-binding RTX toxin-like protein